MKKTLLALLLGVAVLSACSKVPAGNVGIKVYLLGGHKGVDSEVLGVGRYYIGINEELYLFPTFQQNYVWTKETIDGDSTDESLNFQTTEGMSVNADVGISYHLDATKVPLIFQKYRKGIAEITDIYLRNEVRDAFVSIASKYPVESVYGKGKEQLLREVQEKLKASLDVTGIMIDKIYLVGDLRLPANVTNALNSKIQATQAAEQSENELRQAEAEAKKKIAIARGEAEANRMRMGSLTPALVEYERLINERQAIAKWNGALPETMIPGASLPFVNLKNK